MGEDKAIVHAVLRWRWKAKHATTTKSPRSRPHDYIPTGPHLSFNTTPDAKPGVGTAQHRAVPFCWAVRRHPNDPSGPWLSSPVLELPQFDDMDQLEIDANRNAYRKRAKRTTSTTGARATVIPEGSTHVLGGELHDGAINGEFSQRQTRSTTYVLGADPGNDQGGSGCGLHPAGSSCADPPIAPLDVLRQMLVVSPGCYQVMQSELEANLAIAPPQPLSLHLVARARLGRPREADGLRF